MFDDDDAPTPFDPTQICERIEQLADALAWSWSDLEARAGVSRKIFDRWKSGALAPRMGGVRRAAEALGVEYDEITHGLRMGPDPSLIHRAMAGDRASVHALVELLTPSIRGAVTRELGRWRRGQASEQEVADITQAVFVHLFADHWRALRQWEPSRGHTLPGFVALVARNVTIAMLRTRRRNPFQEEPVSPEVFDERAASGAGPESTAISRQAAARIAGRVAEGLTGRGKEMFRLLILEDHPVEDICARTGMTPDAVYQWRNRLHRKLREVAAEVAAAAEPANDVTRSSSVPPSSATVSSEDRLALLPEAPEGSGVPPDSAGHGGGYARAPASGDQAATNCRSTSRR
jgi:RNA polymerase sigma-70 factor (ECF subfamily)